MAPRWEKRALIHRPLSAAKQREDAVRPGGSDPAFCVVGTGSCSFDMYGRRPIAEPEAWASAPEGTAICDPCRTELILQLPAKLVGSCALACDVVANSHCQRRLFVERETVVEARDAERLCGRHVQAPACIFEAAAADPADLVLERVQDGEQQVTLRSRGAPPARGVVVGRRPLAALPEGLGRPKHPVDGRDLRGSWRSPGGANVQLSLS